MTKQDAAIHPLAADHVEIGFTGVGQIGALALLWSEGDIDHGIIRIWKSRTPGSRGPASDGLHAFLQLAGGDDAEIILMADGTKSFASPAATA
jgi:hypothetical protein